MLKEGQGMGLATLEAKLAQNLSRLAHKSLFQVFKDVRNMYDSLDRKQCLEVLRGYGMVPNLARLLAKYWD